MLKMELLVGDPSRWVDMLTWKNEGRCWCWCWATNNGNQSQLREEDM